MTRALAFLLLGIAATGLLYSVASGEFAAPPRPAVIASCLLGVATALTWLGRWAWRLRRERAAIRQFTVTPSDGALAMRLLGDYAPYAAEAARELGDAGDPRAVPLLMRALERAVAERPAGWPETAGAVAQALGRIGDPRGLPVLRRLRAMPDAYEVVGLGAAIALLEAASGLLRPAEPEPADGLLRPAAPAEAGSVDVLLRPAADADEAA